MKTELGFPPTTTAEEIPEQMIPIGSGSLLPATAGASGTGGGGGGISLDETSLLPAGFGRRSGLIKHAMPAVLNGQPAEAAALVANSGNLLGRGMKVGYFQRWTLITLLIQGIFNYIKYKYICAYVAALSNH
jgi:hypothetical protein